MWDVAIVGTGPGGSAAAKLCAEEGLKTIIIERKKLPREKVCSGLLSGKTTINLLREIFGEFPEEVLVDPFYLNGAVIHVAGADEEMIEDKMPTAWRRDLDYWMVQKARAKGVEVLDSTVVLGISEEKGSYRVTVKEKKEQRDLNVRFIIGADGAFSTVRKILYPGLKLHYRQAIQQCYRGALPALDRRYIHIFPDPVRRFVSIINHKGDSFVFEVSARLGEAKTLRDAVAKPFLAAGYGFNNTEVPLWTNGCLEAAIYGNLLSGAFVPARDNILLVGDAAGFQLPTAEGIGTALRSATLATKSIKESLSQGKRAAEIYVKETKGIIEAIRTLGNLGKYNIADGPQAVIAGIRERLLGVLKANY